MTTDTDSERTLAERLIALAPDQLSGYLPPTVRGPSLVSGVKLGTRLIFENIEIIEKAMDAGIRRVAVLDELNKLLSADKQMGLNGFDTALYRARRMVVKKAKPKPAGASEEVTKDQSVNEVVVGERQNKADVAGVDSKKIHNPGDIRQLMSDFDLLAESDD